MTAEPEKISTVEAIREAALEVFTPSELQEMLRPQLRSLGHLLAKRLDQPGAPPTQDELEGIRELVTEHLWHGSLNKHTPGW